MDKIDSEIIEILDSNSRATATEISKRVNLSIPAVADRIRGMEESGIIERYTLKVNRKQVGLKLLVFLFVSVDTPGNTEVFRKAIVEYPEVLECHHIAGDDDYLLKVLMTDTDELEGFISKKLKGIKGIIKTKTIINLSTLKEEFNRKDMS